MPNYGSKPGLLAGINRRAASELGVRALWSAQSDMLHTYDLLQPDKSWRRVGFQVSNPAIPALSLSESGPTNTFTNLVTGDKQTDAESWVSDPGSTIAPNNQITLFAVFSTLDTRTVDEMWLMMGGGLRVGMLPGVPVIRVERVFQDPVVIISKFTFSSINDGLEHSIAVSYTPGTVEVYVDGETLGSAIALTTSVLDGAIFIVGGSNTAEKVSFNGTISIAGQCDRLWTLDDARRFDDSRFELLYAPRRRFSVFAPLVLPPGQIDARGWVLAPVIGAADFVVEPTLQARNLQTLPVVDADDIDVEPVVGARELHTLPVVDDD